MKTTHWRRKDGGWIRSDRKYRILRSPGIMPSQPKWYAEVSQGGKWFAVKDKVGRNTRTWGEDDNAMKAIDKAFPMYQTDHWKVSANHGGWLRSDERFLIQKVAAGKGRSKYYVKENDNGHWTLLKTKNLGNPRSWDSFERATMATDKEFPMNSGPTAPIAPAAPPSPKKKRVNKARVEMDITLSTTSAEASAIASKFLEGAEIQNLSLNITERDKGKAFIQLMYTDPKGTAECCKVVSAFIGSLELSQVKMRIYDSREFG